MSVIQILRTPFLSPSLLTVRKIKAFLSFSLALLREFLI